MLALLDGAPVAQGTRQFGASGQPVYTWGKRYHAGELDALLDKPRRPHVSPHPPGRGGEGQGPSPRRTVTGPAPGSGRGTRGWCGPGGRGFRRCARREESAAGATERPGAAPLLHDVEEVLHLGSAGEAERLVFSMPSRSVMSADETVARGHCLNGVRSPADGSENMTEPPVSWRILRQLIS
ncbi:helix-turn-helix domain-containing protein [Streptomyces sp. NPDC002172]